MCLWLSLQLSNISTCPCQQVISFPSLCVLYIYVDCWSLLYTTLSVVEDTTLLSNWLSTKTIGSLLYFVHLLTYIRTHLFCTCKKNLASFYLFIWGCIYTSRTKNKVSTWLYYIHDISSINNTNWLWMVSFYLCFCRKQNNLITRDTVVSFRVASIIKLIICNCSHINTIISSINL